MYPVLPDCVPPLDSSAIIGNLDIDFNMDFDLTLDSLEMQVDVSAIRQYRLHRSIPLALINGLTENMQALSEQITDTSPLFVDDCASIPVPESPTVIQNPDKTITRRHIRNRHDPLTAINGLSEYMQAMIAPIESVSGAGIPRRNYGNPDFYMALASHAPSAKEIEWTRKLEKKIRMRNAAGTEKVMMVHGKKEVKS